MATVIVDGNNVVGAVADGWWRDRPAAVRRLLARLRCYGERSGDAVLLVLDVPQADLPEGRHGGVEVRYARRRGRNAADERIVEILDERGGLGEPGGPGPVGAPDDTGGDQAGEDGVEVVSSDRALAADARRRGARVVGAGAFLARVEGRGC